MVWICISLVINNVKRLFMYLLTVSSLEKCLFKSSHFKIRFFKNFNCTNYLCILDISFYHMICRYFLLFSMLPFHFVDSFLCCENFLIWYSPTCLVLLLLPLFLMSGSKNHCQNLCQGGYCLCFLLEVLQFQLLRSSL